MVASLATEAAPDGWETPEAETLRGIFRSIDALSCPVPYNFHMHTNCSDGRLTPEALIEQAIGLGLQGLAITDHHNLRGYYQARRWVEDWQWSHPARVRRGRNRGQRNVDMLPRLFTGVEITSQLLDIDVHVLGYGFDPRHPAIKPYLKGRPPEGLHRQAHRVIRAIHGAGGISVLAHPARYRRSIEAVISTAAEFGIKGVETYYAYGNPAEWEPSPKHTPKVEALAKEFRLLCTCGTDTHGLDLTRRL